MFVGPWVSPSGKPSRYSREANRLLWICLGSGDPKNPCPKKQLSGLGNLSGLGFVGLGFVEEHPHGTQHCRFSLAGVATGPRPNALDRALK